MVSPNTALTPVSYVPILKAKRAELDALASCPPDNLVPLLEVIEPASAGESIIKAWPHSSDIAWVQVLNADDVDDSTFAALLDDLFAQLRAAGIAVAPVLTAAEEPATLAAIANIAAQDGHGAVLRIDVEDLIDAGANIAADVTATVAALSLSPGQVDLVADAGLLTGTSSVQSAVATQALGALPTLQDWRTVVVSFSAFPALVSAVVPTQTVGAIPRSDAAAFVATQNVAPRPIVFSDYAIGVPTYGGAAFTPIPNMRYASDTEWYIHRAKERKQPSPQYRALANDIVGASYFSGVGFSPAEQWISDIATSTSGPGNATTHLRIGMSRHLHVVLSRLSTLGAP